VAAEAQTGMKPFKLSLEACRDVQQIWAYIAADSIKAARRVRLQILNACRKIAENPGIGHSREDLTDKPVRFWPVGSYLIIYNPARRPIEIIRVVHGARDVPSLL
jgi:toxin ParE1/3/4